MRPFSEFGDRLDMVAASHAQDAHAPLLIFSPRVECQLIYSIKLQSFEVHVCPDPTTSDPTQIACVCYRVFSTPSTCEPILEAQRYIPKLHEYCALLPVSGDDAIGARDGTSVPHFMEQCRQARAERSASTSGAPRARGTPRRTRCLGASIVAASTFLRPAEPQGSSGSFSAPRSPNCAIVPMCMGR